MNKIVIERRHPEYLSNLPEWNFFWQSYIGGSIYITPTNLFSHRVETTARYNKRLKRAYYYNYCAPVIDIYNQFIYSARIERSGEEEWLVNFRKNASGKGDNIDEMMSKANTLSAIFGTSFATVDVDQEGTPEIITAVYKQRPFIRILKPFNVVDWSLDKQGGFEWILLRFAVLEDSNPLVTRNYNLEFILWMKDSWVKFNESGIELDSGKNSLGFVPIIPINHYPNEDDDSIIGKSMIKDIARVNRGIFNWCSLLDSILYDQTFSLLAVESSGEKDTGIEKIGTAEAFTYEKDTKVPVFIAPDASQAQLFIDWIDRGIREIYRLASLERSGMVHRTQVIESGIAKAFDFVDTNQALSTKAKTLAETEMKITACVFAWEQVKKGAHIESLLEAQETISSKVSVVYPRNFDVRALDKETKAAMDILTMDLSKRFNIQFKKYLVPKYLPNATEEELKEIYKAIEEEENERGRSRDSLNNSGGGFSNNSSNNKGDANPSSDNSE